MIPPINPCGWGVDLLRSCYTTNVKFFKDSEILIPIKWYFTKRPMLPLLRAWGNRYWHAVNGEWSSDLGEVLGSPRPWRNGSRPVEGGVMGAPHFCGTPGQWAGDISIADAHTPDIFGRDPCCNPPPPLGVLLGLNCRFEASSLLEADLSAAGSVLARPSAGGLLPAVLASGTALPCPGQAEGGVRITLAGQSAPTATGRGVGRARVGLSASAGLPVVPHASGRDAVTLSASGSLRETPGAGRLLPIVLAAVDALRVSASSPGGLHGTLSGVSDLRTAHQAAARLASTLPASGGLTPTLHGTAHMSVALDLVGTVRELAAAKGILLSYEEAVAAIRAALDGHAAELPGGSGKLSLSVSFSNFQVVTPAGSCGSLPASIVVRFSGGTGHFVTLNGKSSTLTYNSLSQQWNGNVTTTDGISAIVLACGLGNWALTLSGSAGNGTHQVTGTSGASPSLSGTLTLTGMGTGTSVATITRT